MVVVELKNWQDDNNLYVELAAKVNGAYTTYTKDFPLSHNLQDAIDFCLAEFNNANSGIFILAS